MVTVPRLLEITQAWAVVPPLHRAFAGFLGAFGKGGRTRPAPAASPADSPQFLQDLTALGIPIDPKLLQ